MDKDEALAAAKLPWSEIRQRYPKAVMVIDYISKHYPDDKEKISTHKMLPTLIFSEYSNTEIEEMIDKLAILNHWTKYTPDRSNNG